MLDTIGMSDVDFTGSRALGHVLAACEREHVAFGVARAGDHLREMLRRSGLAPRIGEEPLLPDASTRRSPRWRPAPVASLTAGARAHAC